LTDMTPMSVTDPASFSDLVRLLQHQANARGNRLAYEMFESDGARGSSVTFRQLDARARALAARLVALGDPGDRALMLYPSGIDFVVAFFACLYAGIVGVPLYPPRNNKHLHRLVMVAHDCDARLVLTTSAYRRTSQQLLKALGDGRRSQLVETDLIDDSIAAVSGRDVFEGGAAPLAFLQYTSGSTGTPRGVMVSHRNLLHNVENMHRGYGLDDDAHMVSWLPVHHDLGLIYGVLLPLFGGFTASLIQPAAFMQRPCLWLQAISRRRATISGGPNFAFDLCVDTVTDAQRYALDLSSLRCLLNGAEPVRASTLERFMSHFSVCGFDARAWNPSYGMAESTLVISQYRPGMPVVVDRVDPDALGRHMVLPGARPVVGCGTTFDDQLLEVVDPHTGQSCAPGHVGELWISGPSICQGYWNNAEATREVFGARLASQPGSCFLRTGDLGYVRDGLVFVTGRLKDLIIIRGKNHYPQDIECSVQACWPGFHLECGAAFAVEAEAGEARLVVVHEVARTCRNKIDIEAVGRLAARAVAMDHDLELQTLVIVRPATIPITSSGKIQRRATRALWLDGRLEIVGIWQRSPMIVRDDDPGLDWRAQPARHYPPPHEIRAWLISRLETHLAAEPGEIDPHRSFSELGMTSLVAVTLAREMQDWIGIDIEVNCLYDHPTLERQCQWLESKLRPPMSTAALPAARLTGLENLTRIENLTDEQAARMMSRFFLRSPDG
jgi:acyl-CoA synthetase (AMP-forming)/AMP-acid ligase II/acyl carrier protein